MAPRERYHSESKTFAFLDKYNKITPHVQANNTSLDKKQALWAFFVVRSVVARAELIAG